MMKWNICRSSTRLGRKIRSWEDVDQAGSEICQPTLTTNISGYVSATSMADIPVPQPRSKILPFSGWGTWMGSSDCLAIENTLWRNSSRSCSLSLHGSKRTLSGGLAVTVQNGSRDVGARTLWDHSTAHRSKQAKPYPRWNIGDHLSEHEY